MPQKKKDKEKEYKYILLVKCEECGTVAEFIGPCVKCENMTFNRTYKAVEVK